MFLLNYLNDLEYELVLNKYDEEIINGINIDNFDINYRYLAKNKIFFVNDLVSHYLEIFNFDNSIIGEVLLELEKEYGKDFRFYVGSNIELFNDTLLKILER